ncbi:MAG: zf-HC2 domain-containing protein [Methylibium sp.]|uniref:zf-HC2 domain-containing protein n=1 Tax=Methylibium sp. TaxID=2067992 RepID=UPI0017F49B64|nr:zf-HC2 domain-containing protein [Methylibium sp.]MBA3590890.1 zf-HC2 domain-containing protein [Methylibium sp.]MBA3624156.1 zf-HC2 domain-containing protein [Methylibium sp.]
MSLSYSCRQASTLISRQQDEPLGIADRLRLRVHLSMCSNCSRVEAQLSSLKRLARDVLAGRTDRADELDESDR